LSLPLELEESTTWGRSYWIFIRRFQSLALQTPRTLESPRGSGRSPTTFIDFSVRRDSQRGPGIRADGPGWASAYLG
jgi:hypothetical protein